MNANNIAIQARARVIYHEMFHDTMSRDALDLASRITDVDTLEEYREELSAGEFDAIEAAISKR